MPEGQLRRVVSVDGASEATLRGFAAGTWRLRLTGPGLRSHEQDLVLRVEESPVEVVLRLHASAAARRASADGQTAPPRDPLEAIDHADQAVRFQAVKGLAARGDETAVRRLGVALRQDPDLFVRRGVALALGGLGRKARFALHDLFVALSDREKLVAMAAHVAIVKITGDDPGWRRGMTEDEVRALAAAAARKLGSD